MGGERKEYPMTDLIGPLAEIETYFTRALAAVRQQVEPEPHESPEAAWRRAAEALGADGLVGLLRSWRKLVDEVIDADAISDDCYRDALMELSGEMVDVLRFASRYEPPEGAAGGGLEDLDYEQLAADYLGYNRSDPMENDPAPGLTADYRGFKIDRAADFARHVAELAVARERARRAALPAPPEGGTR